MRSVARRFAEATQRACDGACGRGHGWMCRAEVFARGIGSPHLAHLYSTRMEACARACEDASMRGYPLWRQCAAHIATAVAYRAVYDFVHTRIHAYTHTRIHIHTLIHAYTRTGIQHGCSLARAHPYILATTCEHAHVHRTRQTPTPRQAHALL